MEDSEEDCRRRTWAYFNRKSPQKKYDGRLVVTKVDHEAGVVTFRSLPYKDQRALMFPEPSLRAPVYIKPFPDGLIDSIAWGITPPTRINDSAVAALYAYEHLTKELQPMASETTGAELSIGKHIHATRACFEAETIDVPQGGIDLAGQSNSGECKPVRRDSLKLGDLFCYSDGDHDTHYEAGPGNCDIDEGGEELEWGNYCAPATGGADMVFLLYTLQERVQKAEEELARLKGIGTCTKAQNDLASPTIAFGDEPEMVDHSTGLALDSEEWSRAVTATLKYNAKQAKTEERNRVTLQGNWPGADDPDW